MTIVQGTGGLPGRHLFQVEDSDDSACQSATTPPHSEHLCLLIDDLGGGGVQRMTLTLGGAIANLGHRVDLVICRAEGPLVSQVPPNVGTVCLEPAPQWLARVCSLVADPVGFGLTLRPINLRRKLPGDLSYLPALIRYLKRYKPNALLSATPYLNLAAVWAQRISGVRTRILVSERNNLSYRVQHKRGQRSLPALIRRIYMMTDAIIAVSDAVADDIATVTGIPRERITRIYNPVVPNDLPERARRAVEHPWFRRDGPPVILSAGVLSRRKDFPTLVRAFARVRARQEAKLVILGEAKETAKSTQRRSDLMQLAAQSGVAEDVALLGFVANPFAYLARASVFVLSSEWEGFGNVLVEALACGCPVVSSNCPSGPSEILENGKYGRLVPVGDDAALASSILATLDAPPDPLFLQARASLFSVNRAVENYLKVLISDYSGATEANGRASKPGGCD